MSRVIIHIGGARTAAGRFVFVAPVAAVGVDVVGGQDFSGGDGDDCDGGGVDQGQDWCAAVGVSDGEVM